MPMTYENIDPAAVTTDASATSGFGDPADINDEDVVAAEADACNLAIEHAIFTAHATSVLPNGADPDAVAMQQQADAMVGVRDEARVRADRLAAAKGTDVSGVLQPMLRGHRGQAETQYARSEWTMVNGVGLTQAQQDELQLTCDRAERIAAVVDGWVT